MFGHSQLLINFIYAHAMMKIINDI